MSIDIESIHLPGADPGKPSTPGLADCDLPFRQYSDAELAALITSLQKFDQDRFLNAAHSAAVVD